ncbi:putative phosphotransferase enzyme family protein [Botrytis fragariae]|uniref:Putative phosphotransferase enzyme family protein n=1 Tax=Botrytis fragariae TaxID=1964551 RepID=A0A8H6EHL9_9HELO|nr:putative phosphotransferase enzyme family protein [Botrytis fragariae]KAF5872639.1 putative phosphotransferase enzyme family protein [Botrytis fragariae]
MKLLSSVLLEIHYVTSIHLFVSRVFGWGSASRDHAGWIFQELMPGEPLAEAFEAMPLGWKKVILEQMALFLKALQDYPLPESIRDLGGANFDGSDAVVSGPMIGVGAGPWDSLKKFCRDCLKAALAKAEDNPYVPGWKDDGVRKRIDTFMEKGPPVLFSAVPTKQEKSIIHGDSVPENLLYDPATCRITALLDYDFARILHPAYEFFLSFGSSGGDREAEGLRTSKLTGRFPSPLPTRVAPQNGTGIEWEVAQAWEEALQKMDVKRPSDIPGTEILANIDQLSDALLPWRLANEDFLNVNRDENQRMALRSLEEETLKGLLGHLEF